MVCLLLSRPLFSRNFYLKEPALTLCLSKHCQASIIFLFHVIWIFLRHLDEISYVCSIGLFHCCLDLIGLVFINWPVFMAKVYFQSVKFNLSN